MAILRRIEVVSGARARLCRSVADIRRCIAQGTIAMVMHLEGADALDTSLSLLEELHTAGLRSLGPVWNRRNAFGTGIQGRFPEPPAAGAGLTPAGKRLIQRCLQLRIMVDVSHMDATGFWQTAELGARRWSPPIPTPMRSARSRAISRMRSWRPSARAAVLSALISAPLFTRRRQAHPRHRRG
ncbi:hypothetical protein SODG_001589 [Sodalis praecaptivus]